MIYLEQPVYLTIWKDLNKEKRKEHILMIEPKKWGGWLSVCFFDVGLRAFGAQAVRFQHIFLPILSILDILDNP